MRLGEKMEVAFRVKCSTMVMSGSVVSAHCRNEVFMYKILNFLSYAHSLYIKIREDVTPEEMLIAMI